MIHRKLLGMEGVSIFKYINVLLFFLISFRAPGVNRIALSYSVPPFIRVIQESSLFLCLALLGVSVAVFFLIGKNNLKQKVNGYFLAFIIFHLILVLTDFYYDGSVFDLIVHLFFVFTIYIYFGIIVKEFFLNKEHIKDYILSAFYGIYGFMILNFLLYIGNFGEMTWKGRFHGVTSQPNFIGVCCGLCAVFSIALLFSKFSTSRWQKMIMISGILIGTYLCFLSGSRSASLSIVVSSLTLAFYSLKSAASRYVIVLITVCLGAFVAFNFDAIAGVSTLDYTARGNTREETWQSLYDQVMTLPVFGFGSSASATTNSYLFAIVATGMVGGFFFFRSLYLYALSAIETLKRLDKLKYFTYPLVSLTVFLLIVALFEGFLLDSASMSVFTYWFLLSLK